MFGLSKDIDHLYPCRSGWGKQLNPCKGQRDGLKDCKNKQEDNRCQPPRRDQMNWYFWQGIQQPAAEPQKNYGHIGALDDGVHCPEQQGNSRQNEQNDRTRDAGTVEMHIIAGFQCIGLRAVG